MSRPTSSLTTAAQETLDLLNDDTASTVSFRSSKLSYGGGAPIFGSAAPRNRTLSKVKQGDDHRTKRDSPTLPQAWRHRTVSESVARSPSLSSIPSISARANEPTSPTASSPTTMNSYGTRSFSNAGTGLKTPSRQRAGSKATQSNPNSTTKQSKRPDSPDIDAILAKTPRPRRRTSAMFPSHSHSHSHHSIAPSVGRRQSAPLSSFSSLNARSPPRGGALKRDLNALGGGLVGEDDSLLSDYGSILDGDSPFDELECLEMELEMDGGSESDSSIDVHTPLPHLMFRDGLLSPRSKLLPQSLKQPSYPDPYEDRSKSVLSIASTTGSVKTKSGLQKDPRHTERRRVRHRDGSLLRAGMGLTTGLGWSDSEDEDAPSALTRRLISTTIERKRSTTIGGGGPSPPPGCGPFFSPPSAYEHHETHAPRHSSPFPGRSGSPLSKMALPTRKTSSIGGLRSTSASFPASVSPVIAKKEVPVPVPRTFSHTRNDSSNSDSPRSGITPTPPASSSSPASSVATPPFSSQDDVQSDLPRQHVDSTASDASTSTSRVPRSRASSYSASIYSTSTVNPLESPPSKNAVLPTTRARKDSSPSVSTTQSNGSGSRTDPSIPVAENVPGSRRRAGSGGSAASRSTSRSKGRNRAGSSASSGTPPSTYRIPRSLSKMQSLDTIESTLENRVSVASSASSYSHQSAQGGGGSSSSGSSHSTVPRPLMLPQTLGAGNSLVRSFSQESNSVYSSTGSIGEAGFSARPTQFSNPRSYANYPSSPPLQSSISSPPLSSGTEFSLLSSGGSSRPTSPGSSPRPRPPVSPVGARPRPRTGTGMAYRTSSGVEYRTSSYGFGATSFVGDPSARLRSLSLAAAAVRESGVALGRNTNGVHAARPVVNVAVVGLVSGRGSTSAGGSRPSPSGMVDGKF